MQRTTWPTLKQAGNHYCMEDLIRTKSGSLHLFHSAIVEDGEVYRLMDESIVDDDHVRVYVRWNRGSTSVKVLIDINAGEARNLRVMQVRDLTWSTMFEVVELLAPVFVQQRISQSIQVAEIAMFLSGNDVVHRQQAWF